MSIIILGAGKIGYNLARELTLENRDVTIIDWDHERIEELEEYGEDLNIIQGNGSDPDILIKAGIKEADLLIAVTERDETNIAASYIADRLSSKVKKIARVREIDPRIYGDIFTNPESGIIDSIINPEELCAIKIANILKYPGIVDINYFCNEKAVLIGLEIDKDTPCIGKTLIEIGKDRKKYKIDAIIGGIIRKGETIVPTGKTILKKNDLIYVMTLKEYISKVIEYFLGPQEELKNISILGGTNIGFYLARIIENEGFNVKLIEKNVKRANILSEKLENTLVLKGEPLDKAIYELEGIDKSDVFVAVTLNQEENIIATLHAKSKGVKKGICILYKQNIASLVKKIGIDITIHPQQLAIGKILEYIRKGKVGSVAVLNPKNDLEAIEIQAIENSKLVNKKIKDVKVPKSSLILAISRKDGTIKIPDGNTIIYPEEKVIFICKKEVVKSIEKLIS